MTGVDAPGQIRGLDHGRDDDNDRSGSNSSDGKSRLRGRMLGLILTCVVHVQVCRDGCVACHVSTRDAW